MIDAFLLAPYWAALKLRHLMFDKGWKKSFRADIPTICIGNVSVGGTGKTPHTEMLLKMLLEDFGYMGQDIAVLSRGYKRKSKGFQQVTLDGTAEKYGDEPLQIKKKFPGVTVAVEKNRMHGLDMLAHPEKIGKDRKSRRCANMEIETARIAVLDDAMQYRQLIPDVSIVLVDYNRPVHKDHLMPMGHLRDLPERLSSADIVIVTKCPAYLEDNEEQVWRENLKLREGQALFFTKTEYCPLEQVYPEGEPRFLYSKRLILFTGIANDKPLFDYLSDSFKVVRHLTFPDHHSYTQHDINSINHAALAFPTALVATTEKDSQRVKDCKKTPETLKQRMFRVPIEVSFVGENERERFVSVLDSLLKESRSEPEQKPRE